MNTALDSLPPWFWPAARVVAYVYAWVICLCVAYARLQHAWHEYDDPPDRPVEWKCADGNRGHTLIDFGGQWVMGRLAVTGHAAELYDRNRQWEAVRAGYPRDREAPAVRDRAFPAKAGDTTLDGGVIRHDADDLLWAFMGRDSPRWSEVGNAVAIPFSADSIIPNPFAAAALAVEANARLTPDVVTAVNTKPVGGPLYPPIHGFLYAPFGLFSDPTEAYGVFQVTAVAVTFLAGFAAASLSRWRVWWPIATTAILLYPGCRSGLDLGQNPTFTLTIVFAGWALAARGRETSGGMVWGLLAFKPVWAAAFFLVPLLMGRWRFCLVMVATGAGLALATLPFTGIEPWQDWLANGKEATELYDTNKNWVTLGRDLHGIPRRILLDFDIPEEKRHSPTAAALGWALWVFVVGTTATVYLLAADRRNRTGLGAGFLFLGAFLSCYRFMYYDALLSAVGVLVLFADPGRLVRFAAGEPNRLPPGPRWTARIFAVPVLVVGLLYLCENEWYRYQPKATVEAAGMETVTTNRFGGTMAHTPKLTAEIGYYHPWDTLLVLALWGWCGWRLAWGEEEEEGLATKRHEEAQKGKT